MNSFFSPNHISKNVNILNLSSRNLKTEDLIKYLKKFSELTNLNSLNLSSNSISYLPKSFGNAFKNSNLKSIDLTSNLIKSSDLNKVVDELKCIPSLKELRIDISSQEETLFILSSLLQIDKLNGIQVKERRNEESLDNETVKFEEEIINKDSNLIENIIKRLNRIINEYKKRNEMERTEEILKYSNLIQNFENEKKKKQKKEILLFKLINHIKVYFSNIFDDKNELIELIHLNNIEYKEDSFGIDELSNVVFKRFEKELLLIVFDLIGILNKSFEEDEYKNILLVSERENGREMSNAQDNACRDGVVSKTKTKSNRNSIGHCVNHSKRYSLMENKKYEENKSQSKYETGKIIKEENEKKQLCHDIDTTLLLINYIISTKTSLDSTSYNKLPMLKYLILYFKNKNIKDKRKLNEKTDFLYDLTSFLDLIKNLSRKNIQISLFGKILKNEIDEEFYIEAGNIKESLFNLLKTKYKSKFKNNPIDNKLVSSFTYMNLFFSKEESKEIIQNICLEDEVDEIFNEKVFLKSNSHSLLRLINIILGCKVKTRLKFLYKIRRLFIKLDKNNDEILSINEYFTLLDSIFIDDSQKEDVKGKFQSTLNKDFSFSEVVNFLLNENVYFPSQSKVRNKGNIIEYYNN